MSDKRIEGALIYLIKRAIENEVQVPRCINEVLLMPPIFLVQVILQQNRRIPNNQCCHNEARNDECSSLIIQTNMNIHIRDFSLAIFDKKFYF